MSRQVSALGVVPPIEKFFLVLDMKNKIIQASAQEQECMDICKTGDGMKKRYRMVETTVTRIHVFGAWDSEKTF